MHATTAETAVTRLSPDIVSTSESNTMIAVYTNRNASTAVAAQKPATASPIWTMKGVPGSAVFQKVMRKPLG